MGYVKTQHSDKRLAPTMLEFAKLEVLLESLQTFTEKANLMD